jgi:thymidylate kinase
MIIIEGIDGTGKTSLAEQLEKANFERYHLGYDEKKKYYFL